MWLQLTSIDRVTEFDKHYCDRDLRDFLRGEPDMFAEIGVLSPGRAPPVSSESGAGDNKDADNAGAAWLDEEEGHTDTTGTVPSSSPQYAQGAQPRQRRPGRTNYIK